MMKQFILMVLAVVVMAGIVWAAGTSTQTFTQTPTGEVGKVEVAWVADAALSTVPDADIERAIHGFVLQATYTPGGTACTDLFNLYVYDEDGVDVFGGALVDITATGDQAYPAVGSGYGPRWVDGTLTVNFSDLGTASCEGSLFIYYTK